jgi:iron(III) transport system substrate-binding protein
MPLSRFLAACTAAALLSGAALAAELNLYSGRHYEADNEHYARFTAETGIKVNVIEGKADELLARLEAEGNASPADVFLTADAGNLWRAEQKGLFQPVESEILKSRVPEALRDPGNRWFGFSKRARVIMVAKDRVDPAAVPAYASLTAPELKGKLCMRSGSNIYNLSLMSSIIAGNGEAAAEEWAEGIVANLAKPPEGGDTDQIKSVAAGECDVTVSNTYYLVRLMKSANEDDRAAAAKISVVFPDQDGAGTHVNISGAGVLANAPNRENAVKFLEFLAGDEAQRFFALGNNEYPVALKETGNAELDGLGTFKENPLNVRVYGENQPKAQAIMDRAGWK